MERLAGREREVRVREWVESWVGPLPPGATLWESLRSGVRLLGLLARVEKELGAGAAAGERVRRNAARRRVRTGQRPGAQRRNLEQFVVGCSSGALRVRLTMRPEDFMLSAQAGSAEACLQPGCASSRA